MSEPLLLSGSLSRTRFGSSGGETAGGGGCWRCPNTEGEDQALCLQQHAGLWVPLLLPPGYHLGQYSQVNMRIQTQICWMHTCNMSQRMILGLIKGTALKPSCRRNTCCYYGCINQGAVVHSVSKSKVCRMFIYQTCRWIILSLHSKTTVYGVGSPPSRRRRSAGRCTCARPNDQTCSNFCRHRWVPASKRSGEFVNPHSVSVSECWVCQYQGQGVVYAILRL